MVKLTILISTVCSITGDSNNWDGQELHIAFDRRVFSVWCWFVVVAALPYNMPSLAKIYYIYNIVRARRAQIKDLN